MFPAKQSLVQHRWVGLGDKVKLGSHQRMVFERSRMGIGKNQGQECTWCCWARAKRGTSLELQVQDQQSCLVGWVYKETLFKQGKGSWELTSQESISCCCLIIEVAYRDNTQVIYTLDGIWNCVLAGLAVLSVSFPQSPSGDQALQAFQLFYI